MQYWVVVALVTIGSVAEFAAVSVDAVPLPGFPALPNSRPGAGSPRLRPTRDITNAFMRRWSLTSMVASGLGYPGLGFEGLELAGRRLPLAQTYSARELPLANPYW